MSYSIGSLNLLRSKRTEEGTRDFHSFIHDLIIDERLDIIGFQEAYKKSAIDDLCRALGLHWKCVHWEGHEFSFIWNTRRVIECSKQGEPNIFNGYRSDFRMYRDPLYGRFTPNGLGPFSEFRLLDVHFCWTEPIQRNIDYQLATGVIYDTVDTHRYGNFKPAFTLVLGDYNLSCEECDRIDIETGNHKVTTVQEELTTLKNEGNGYASNYDHFSYDIGNEGKVSGRISRIDAVNKYFNGDFEKYRRVISDHVPVIIEFF